MNTTDGGSGRRRVGRSRPLKWRVEDSLWERLEPLLADPPRRFRYPGRCRYPARACLEGILYVLFTDTPWLEVLYRERDLPAPLGGVVATGALGSGAARLAAASGRG